MLRIEDLLEMNDRTDLLNSMDWQRTRQISYFLIDRLVEKDFDEDDLHRISDSVNTAFYEGEGMMFIGGKCKKDCCISAINLNWMVFSLKNPYPICSLSIILLAPALPAKGFPGAGY